MPRAPGNPESGGRQRWVIRGCLPDDPLGEFGVAFAPDVDVPRRRRTLVAVADGAVVGAAAATWSRRHPDFVAANVAIRPSHRGRGIGSALLSALQDLAREPLLFHVEREATDCEQVLATHGYHRIVDSATVRVGISEALATLRPARDPQGVRIAVDSLTPEIEGLYEEVYADHHRWAGRYVPTPDKPWIRFAGPVIPESVWVAWAGDVPLAVTSLHSGEYAAGADAFLPATGLLRGEGQLGAGAILRSLVARSLEAADRAGLLTVNIECDTPYAEFQALVTSLPSEPISQSSMWAVAPRP